MDEKKQIVDFGKRMLRTGLVRGTSGNISLFVREQGVVFMTPTGVDYEQLQPEQITMLTIQGQRLSGDAASSEASMHLSIYRARPDILALVHTHSMYAMTFAVLGKSIPAIHYMVAMLGDEQIPITSSYELYGTEALAKSAVAALEQRYYATLLKNHGMIAGGASLAEAFQRAVVVEEMAELYHHTLAVGEPQNLSQSEMKEVLGKIANYGKPQL